MNSAAIIERWLLIAAGLAPVYPATMFAAIGTLLVAVVCARQHVRRDAGPRTAR